ncbi:MAG: prolipoprotein diacylglyceryl transferase family protein, partial [Candidatus Latescibacterota bacterium]
MYPYLLEIGPITIASFGLMVALGFLAALQVLSREFVRKDIAGGGELASSIITTAMVGGLVGAKLYFVLFETPSNLEWGELFDLIFSGYGLTWYGGFIVAAAAITWQVHRHQVPVLLVADAAGGAAAGCFCVGGAGGGLPGGGGVGG